MLQPAPGSTASKVQLEQQQEQMKRVTSLFKRQLAVPLLGKCDLISGFQSVIYVVHGELYYRSKLIVRIVHKRCVILSKTGQNKT